MDGGAVQIADLQAVERRLTELGAFREDWDGYGAERPTSAAIGAARALVMAADDACPGIPFIAPVADGGLQLEWTAADGRELILTIGPNGTPGEFLVDRPNGKGTLEGEIQEPAQLRGLMRTFCGEPM
jgi:hypothetical protein